MFLLSVCDNQGQFDGIFYTSATKSNGIVVLSEQAINIHQYFVQRLEFESSHDLEKISNLFKQNCEICEICEFAGPIVACEIWYR